MPKNKVILFYPKPDPHAENSLPLNLMAIARMLDTQLFDVEIVNATIEKRYVKKISQKVKSGNTLCIGITALTGYQIHDALNVSKKVKKQFPQIPIIWGGYHPSILPLETLNDPTVDIVVKGQGEVTFKELVEKLSNNESLRDVLGIAYKDDKQILKENPDRPFEDLNKFPSLSWDLVDVDKYIRNDIKWGKTIGYYTSQGCPFNCAFCAEAVFSKRRWVALSAERVVNEIEILKNRYNLDTIAILDSNFFVSKKRVKDICEQIIKHKLKLNFIEVNGRIDTLLSYEDEMWELLYIAGFRDFLVGVESGNQTVLDMLNKKIKVNDIFCFFEKVAKYNFSVFVSLMTGLPGINNKTEFGATIDLLDKMLLYNSKGLSNSYIFQYTPYPGSFLYEQAKQYGFVAPDSLEKWSKMNLYNTKSPWVSSKYKKYANYLSLYILRRFFNPFQSKTYLIRLLYDKIIDPVFRWRWKHRYFDFFIEKQIVDFLNFMGRLKAKIKSKK